MDLKSLEVKSETTTITLYHPVDNVPIKNDDGTDMTVTIHGKYSAKYREIQQNQQNARLKRAERGGKMKLTAAELLADRMDLTVGCVDSWSIQLDGSVPDCNTENVRAIFVRFPWMREQIEAEMEDTQAFLSS
jgi:hypothetical protein